ncbi:MAG: hypothetical protein KJI71_03170 [Patescibacteria group bacterium]|nr:hypothetical protein [Patescibacteria group bacterium]
MDIIIFLRQFRIAEFAAFDLTGAFLLMFLLSPLLSRIFRAVSVEIPKRNWVFLTLPISIIVHLSVGQMTPMTRDFLDIGGHYFLKIVIIGFLVLGLKGIKKIKNV